jgi:predicted O-methyltransferase YrrM
MMSKVTTAVATAQDYHEAFAKEAASVYPVVDTLEQEYGHALESARYLDAARVLACPVKPNPPNWQHGRVLYAIARHYFDGWNPAIRFFNLLDIGTAKGYSALCLQWALTDAGKSGHVVSIDVVDPMARVRRNTVAELNGYLTLLETLQPWPEAHAIAFRKASGREWLTANRERIHLAFVDGKHSYEAVRWEAALLASRQQPGDVVMFDDVHMLPVGRAVRELVDYEVRYIEIHEGRRYAIGRRK